MRSEIYTEAIEKLVSEGVSDNCRFPMIFIGRPAYLLRKRISGSSNLHTLENIEDVRDFTEKYYNLPIEEPIYLQDISRMDFKTQDVLLKFLEDSTLKIVLIASFDRVRPTIMSRMKFYYKSSFAPVASSFKSLKDYSLLDETESEHKKVEIIMDFPLVSYFKSKFGNNVPSKLFRKLLTVIE